MAFRRPRVNVKPNVQATRPVNNAVRSQETPVESISTQPQEEQSTPQIDPPLELPIVKGIDRSTKFHCTTNNRSQLITCTKKNPFCISPKDQKLL